MATFENVGETLRMMGEISGRVISPGAAAMMAEDLSAYDPDAVMAALRSCRNDLGRFPSVNDIVSRIESRDGRPAAEEAWARIPKTEDGSVVWTDEMAAAYSLIAPMLKSGDDVGARMAFKEKYSALVKDSREKKQPVRWTFSGGTDAPMRESTIKQAVAYGLLSENVLKALGFDSKPEQASLPDHSQELAPPEVVREKLRTMIAEISKPIPEAT